MLNFKEYKYLDISREFSETGASQIVEKFNNILSYYVLFDYPEIFWSNGIINVRYTLIGLDVDYRFEVNTFCSATDAEAYTKGVNKIIDSILNGTDFDKVLWTYEWIIENTVHKDSPFDFLYFGTLENSL